MTYNRSSPVLGRSLAIGTSSVFGAAAFVGLSLASSEARASCDTPEAQMQVTIPADGAVDVPLDTGFVFFAAIQPQEVMLDDVSLERDGMTWRAPQQLAPETDYQMTLRFSEPGDSADTGEVALSFTTGSGLATGASPEAPTILGDQDGAHDSGSACRRYAASIGCPDQEDPAWVKFEAAPSSAVGWLVSAVNSHPEFDSLWPATCSSEILWRGYADEDCFEVVAIDAAGRFSEPSVYCVENVDLRPWEDPSPSGSGGGEDSSVPDGGESNDASTPDGDESNESTSCSSASGPAVSPLWSILLALVAVRCRRRPRVS